MHVSLGWGGLRVYLTNVKVTPDSLIQIIAHSIIKFGTLYFIKFRDFVFVFFFTVKLCGKHRKGSVGGQMEDAENEQKQSSSRRQDIEVGGCDAGKR